MTAHLRALTTDAHLESPAKLAPDEPPADRPNVGELPATLERRAVDPNVPPPSASAGESQERPAHPGPSIRLAGFAILAWALALLVAALDEYWSLPHAASINAALFLMAVLVISSLMLALQRARAWRRAQDESQLTDPVTSLPNHRLLHATLEEEMGRAIRFQRPLSLVLVDVSSMKSLNRELGWECGDQVLRHVSQALRRCQRGSDLAARLSADRFAMILPECDAKGARVTVERLEEHLAHSPAQVEIDGKSSHLWVGVSAGVASVPGEALETGSDLMRQAEANLSVAKAEKARHRRLWLSSA